MGVEAFLRFIFTLVKFKFLEISIVIEMKRFLIEVLRRLLDFSAFPRTTINPLH